MELTETKKLGAIVAGNYKTAEVFEKYGLDFCCKGFKTINEACQEKGIDPESILSELKLILADAEIEEKTYNDLSLTELVNHIVSKHHAYVKRVMPVIVAHVEKISHVHGTNHPELNDVEKIFKKIYGDFTAHLQKEEMVLFPYITAMEKSLNEGTPAPNAFFGTVANPIAMMEAEHETAGAELEQIKELTHHFTPPADGCTTYRVTLQELNEFTRDLHQHVHLENYILHPKAKLMEKKLLGN